MGRTEVQVQLGQTFAIFCISQPLNPGLPSRTCAASSFEHYTVPCSAGPESDRSEPSRQLSFQHAAVLGQAGEASSASTCLGRQDDGAQSACTGAPTTPLLCPCQRGTGQTLCTAQQAARSLSLSWAFSPGNFCLDRFLTSAWSS